MINQIQGHSAGVSSLRCSDDGLTLCSTSSDNTAKLWDLRSCDAIATLEGHSDTVNASIFESHSTLITCSDDRSVLFWDNRNLSTPFNVIRGFTDGVNQLKLTTIDGARCLISAVDDGFVYIHKINDVTEMRSFCVATNTVNDLLIDPINPEVLVTCSEDCSVRSWKLNSQIENKEDESLAERLISSLDEFENPVNHLALRGGWIFVACAECVFATEYIGEGQFGESARGYSCHSDYVRGIEFIDDETMLSTSDDATVVEWSIASCEPRRQVKVHDDYTMAMTTAPPIATGSSLTLITGCEDGKIRLWSLPFATQPFA